MRAAILEGVNQSFKINNTEDPQLHDGQVIVDVKYCALNHRDLWISLGQYAGLKFPIILGSDISGVSEGENVFINPSYQWGADSRFQSNDFQILGLPSNGGLAEKVAVYKSQIHAFPKHLSFIEASAIPLAGLTAYRALCSRANAKASDKVFISGIGGGVALFALQFALSLGCEVFVSSSSDDKIEKAISLGAKSGINYNDDQWNKKFLANHGGMDVIIDGAGGKDFSKLIKICNPGGRISLYGATQGAWEGLVVQQIFWKQLSILGSTMGSDEDFAKMVSLIDYNKIRPVIDSVFPLNQINEAIDHMAKGKQFGKIVIDITA
ncbi:MAG: zinc-binding dehydrogenase [Saprospiraceae bacterium]